MSDLWLVSIRNLLFCRREIFTTRSSDTTESPLRSRSTTDSVPVSNKDDRPGDLCPRYWGHGEKAETVDNKVLKNYKVRRMKPPLSPLMFSHEGQERTRTLFPDQRLVQTSSLFGPSVIRSTSSRMYVVKTFRPF